MERCPNCRGSGMQVRIQQLGPGMVQQIQSVCGECHGQGERINPKDRCKACAGKKVCYFSCLLSFSVFAAARSTSLLFSSIAGHQGTQGARGAHRQGHVRRPEDSLQRRRRPGAGPRTGRHSHRARREASRQIQVSLVVNYKTTTKFITQYVPSSQTN